MANPLNQEQVQSLLSTLEDGNRNETSSPNDDSAVIPCALGSTEQISRGSLPGLELLVERFARMIRQTLARELGVNCEVTMAKPSFDKLGKVSKQIVVPSSLHIFKMPPLSGSALFVVSPRLAQGFIDCLFGGMGRIPKSSSNREPSAVEVRLLSKLVAALLDDWRESWSPVKAVDCIYVSSETNPLALTLGAATDEVVVVECEVEMGGEAAPFSIVVPSFLLEPVRRKLESDVHQAVSSVDSSQRARIRKSLAKVGAEMRVVLAQGKITGREVLSMSVGDVLPLETRAGEDAVVYVEDKPKFKAKIGSSRGSKSAKISKLIITDD